LGFSQNKNFREQTTLTKILKCNDISYACCSANHPENGYLEKAVLEAEQATHLSRQMQFFGKFSLAENSVVRSSRT